MADSKLTGLTANTTPALTDLLYLVDDPGGTPLSQKITVANLLATPSPTLVTPILGVATGTTLSLTPAGSIQNTLSVNHSDGTPRVQIGVYPSSVSYAGFWAGNVSPTNQNYCFLGDGNIETILNVPSASGTIYLARGGSDYALQLSSFALFAGTGDLIEQRRTTNAQTFRVYGTYTDASNYERASLSHVTGTGALLAAQTAGTGADNLDLTLTPAGTGNVVFPGGVLLKTGAALTDGAAAAAGTLLNAPTAGNPTKWAPINDNGTTRYVPLW